MSHSKPIDLVYNQIFQIINFVDMFEQERPIKPSKQYIERQAQPKQIKKQTNYLRKAKCVVLPCQKQNYQTKINQISKGRQRIQSESPKNKLIKAEKYEQIRKINRQKFGQWNRNKKTNQKQNDKQQIKIRPSQITVWYKPKQVLIDIQQYKKKEYNQGSANKNPQPKNALVQNEKMEYKKMIQFMKRCYGQFQKQKEMFEKQKQYLKYKKRIQNQQGIEIIPKVETGTVRIRPNSIKNQSQSGIKTQNMLKSLGQIQRNTQIQNIQNENQDLQPQDSTKIRKFQYKLESLHQCNPFKLQEIYKYTNPDQFIAYNNQLFQTARQVLEAQRNNRQNKVKLIKPKCTHGSIGANHAVCLEQECKQKRVTKFGNSGWYELWIAGKYRTVYNSQLGYKAVWYNNGDIKQELRNGKTTTYQSKALKVIQVRVQNNLPFWYFPYINQLEMKDDKNNKQIIYSDGRYQLIHFQQPQ